MADPTLPEEEPELPAEVRPLDVLVDAASDLDPTPRARALRLLVEHAEDPGGGEWAARALLDPSPWVQRAGVEGLVARLPEPESAARLEGYVARQGADPYVRGLAARHLGTATARDAMARAWRAARRSWERAPLALAAAVLGDAEAVEPLGRALASGELGLETSFVAAVGASGLTALLPALAAAGEAVEDELVLPLAGARLALGDPDAEPIFRRALADADVERGLEAVDVLAALDHEAAVGLLRRARQAGSEPVRRYAELVSAAREGEVGPIGRAATDADPELRGLAMRFAAEAVRRAPADRRVAREARRVVELGLADELPTVRLAALDAATVVDLDVESALLEANLRHPVAAIRLGAAGALWAHPPVR